MPASPQDKFKKVGANTVTSLAAPGKNLAATSINVGSTTNYPTDTGLVIGIRIVDSNGNAMPGTYTEWNGMYDSPTSLTIESTPVYGTDQVYGAGATTQVFLMVSSSLHNQMVDGLLTEHTQSGGHKSNISVNGQPLSDFVLSVSGGWANLTDTWTYSAWDNTNKIATINVPSDATTRYSVGMKLKFTQSTGGTKYGCITQVVSATQLKAYLVSGTFANETITAPAYSVVEQPFGYPPASSIKVGTINAPTFDTTGNKSITGVGFKPRLVEFTLLPASNGVVTTTGSGAMDSAGNQFITATTGTTTTASRNSDSLGCIGGVNSGAASWFVRASYVSMDSDGFTINVTTAGIGSVVGYVAYA